MSTHISLVKLLVDAVINGRLILNEKNGRVRFELFSEFCSVSGALITRWDWGDRQGRPGLMSMIDHVEFECSKTTYAELFEGSREFEEVIKCLLQERLAPEQLYKLDVDNGWLLTAFNSPPCNESKEAAACSST